MEGNIIALAAALTAFALFLLEHHRRYRLEQKIDHLVHELDCFLWNGETHLAETLGEGRVENLKNQLSAVTEQATHQRRHWKKREERLTQFMENMAHQMKTSLTALQIRVDLAQVKASSPEVQAELDACQNCMERLTGEVGRILECSQLAGQKINMRPERCSVGQLLHRAASLLEPLRKKKGVGIVWELSALSGIPELCLDSYWFSQAVENVIKNAIEHTPADSTVHITAIDCTHSLVLEIRDEGPGIPEDELPCLFERFHRGSYGKAGYGIGLSMARDILKAHHGSIQAGNQKGGGACFLLKLPILEGNRPYEAVREIVREP